MCWRQLPGKQHLLSPLPCVPLAAPGAFWAVTAPVPAGLWHSMEPPRPLPLAPSHGGSSSALLGRVCPGAGASQDSQVEGHRVSSRPGQADCGDEQVGCRRSAQLWGLRLPQWSHSWLYRHPSSGPMPWKHQMPWEHGRIAGGFVTYGTNRYHSLILGCLGESQLCS